LNYEWDFGDGQTSTGIVTNHAYSAIGNYTVKLTVYDNDGLNGTASEVVKVIENPVASFTFSPTSPLINEIVAFDASASSPNGGSLINYGWDFGDGELGSGKIVTHSYADFGNHTVTLLVIDSEGLNDTETKTIRVYISPVASFTYSPEQPWVASTLSLNAASSHDSDGFIAIYQWDFGDGNVTVVSNPIIGHIYKAPGSFTVILTVFDSDGLSGSSSKILAVVVHDVAILSVSLSSAEVQAGQQVNVTVVVKNTGTTAEAFNVTVFYNDTKLETKPCDEFGSWRRNCSHFYLEHYRLSQWCNLHDKG